MTETIEILRALIREPTISRTDNGGVVALVRERLEPLGATVELVGEEEGRRNMWVTIGPADRPGIVLSGHSDVVPIARQNWTVPPFELTEAGGRLHGRGTADMKGFLASAIAFAERAAGHALETPLHLAISYDEEIGCVGVRSLLARLKAGTERPLLCIVGEPTCMRLATGHKGKLALRAICIGREAHSALAPQGLNAITLAAEFVVGLQACQEQVRAAGREDAAYEVPFSTIHAGMIRGGEALNIVPARCTVDFELRTIAGDDPQAILAGIAAMADEMAGLWQARFPEAAIMLETVTTYPGLHTADERALGFVAALTGANERIKVPFGTEGGLFTEAMDMPVVICGPGSMDQGHKPDEYVTREQLTRCDEMLEALLPHLKRGVVL